MRGSFARKQEAELYKNRVCRLPKIYNKPHGCLVEYFSLAIKIFKKSSLHRAKSLTYTLLAL